jgi:para-nitrobenzyl esterase
MNSVRARVDTGVLLGTEAHFDDQVVCFKGIPYAAAPIGDLRWRPPAPVARWDGERPALHTGPAPLQSQPAHNNIMWHANFADRQALVMSEDCLYLNVWTPDLTGGGLPVLVFLQGGGNRFGNGGQEIHDGASLARRGIVVVTLNMRLGALGFLAHPELSAEDQLGASGNYGLLDVVAALAWVQRNIAAFGGDPGRVTFGGNSAGAAIVTHLIASPAADGLFHAAIGQSAAGIQRAEGSMPTLEEAQLQSRRALGPMADLDLAQLRRLAPVSFLLEAHLGIVVDHRAITEDTDGVYARGGQPPIPLLAGWNTDEGANFTTRAAVKKIDELLTTSPHSPKLRAHYSPDAFGGLQAAARAFVGDTRFAAPVWAWARAHSARGAPTWLYQFDHEPPLPAGIDLASPPDGGASYGVFHTAELPYTADNLGCRPWRWTETDTDLARTVGDTWARFVTTHDPRGGGLPHWPQFQGQARGDVMIFGNPIRSGTVQRGESLAELSDLPRPL